MNKIEALNIFVKENISFLSSPDATSSIIKKMRIEFKRKRNLKKGIFFTNRDVAETVIQKISQIKRGEEHDEILHKFMKIPFILKEVPEKRIEEIIVQNIDRGASILTTDDLRKIKRKPYLEGLEKQFEQKAMERVQKEMAEEMQKLEELIAEVEKEREDLSKYKSELDELPEEIIFEKEDMISETETGISEIPWWKKIGLQANPFPPFDKELIGIPKDLYDRIVVRTKFVERYLTKAENNPEDFLGQSIAILGEFGSGKTTLLKMVCYKLGAKGIFPCNVILLPCPDAGALEIELLRQIGIGLGQITTVLSSGVDKRAEYGFIDSLSKLSLILEDFKKYGGKGLVISVDGLHKGNIFFKQTEEFLQQLQNIHEFIEQREIPCGFLLAGSLFWEKEIANMPSMSGSISKIDIIPPLAEEDAVKAVVRRIESFSLPGGVAPTIRKEGIKAAYRTLIQRSKEQITFRNFMKHIRDRLKVGNYDEVGIEVSSHFETVEKIRKYVESSEIANEFKVIEGRISVSSPLRKILCELLPKIYQNRGIEESDRSFRCNMKVFNLLKNQELIVKRKSSRKGPFVWSISPSLARILKNIQNKYSVPPEDALTVIFESREKAISKEATTVYSNIISGISECSTFLKDSWPEISRLLGEIKELLKKIEKQVSSKEIKEFDSSLLTESCKLMINCVLRAGGINLKDNEVENLELFKNFWCAPENTNDIIKVCKYKKKTFNSPSEVFGLLYPHCDILEQLLDLLLELIKGEAFSRLINRRLVNTDMRSIHKARNLFLNHSYMETVDVICELLEEKVRDIGFSVIRTIWGEKWSSIVPSDISEKLSKLEIKGHPRAKRALDTNFFYDLSRSEYGKIIFQKQVRRAIFGEIKNIDFTRMKDMWELTFSLGDRKAHRDRPKYFREHATEIADALRVLPLICEKFLVVVERFLFSMKFQYEKQGNLLIGKYMLEDLPIQPAKIITKEKSAKRIINTILSSLERNPREAIPLHRLLIVEGESLEAQVAMINAMIWDGLININSILWLKITEKGKKILEKSKESLY